MQFHEILNKQKFICFAHREHEKKKKNIQRLKRIGNKEWIKQPIVKSIKNEKYEQTQSLKSEYWLVSCFKKKSFIKL